MNKATFSTLLILSTVSFTSYCQIADDFIIEQIENNMEQNDEEEIPDYTELIEYYWQIKENPININGDDIESLAEYHIISIFQLEKIKEYRKKYGDFLIPEELGMIEGIDDMTLKILQSVVCFQDEAQDKARHKIPKINELLKYSKHQVIAQIEQKLENAKEENDYLGSPQKLYLRYNCDYKDLIQIGIVAEKDAGEYLFKNNLNDSIKNLLGNKCYNGFDFVSFHLYLKNISFVKSLAIGDYKLAFGQGLTMGAGLAFTATGCSLMRKATKIKPSKSANEGGYLRGAATTLQYKNLEISVFYSYKKGDGKVSVLDSVSNEAMEISTIYQTGLHRNVSEISSRRSFGQQLFGGNVSYRNANFQIGYIIHNTRLSCNLVPNTYVYNTFYFRGKSLTVQGLDFYYTLPRAAFYGEGARSDNGGLAAIIGVTVQPKGYIGFTISYRNYAKDFQNFYSNAFSSGSTPRNEESWYLGTSVTFAPNWNFNANADFPRYKWIKNQCYAPSQGENYIVQIKHDLKSNASFSLKYRYKNKMKNTENQEIYERYLINDKTNSVIFSASYPIGDNFIFKNRVEYATIKSEESDLKHNYLIYQDINYRPSKKPFDFSFRYALFRAESGSVYAYEDDVLYSFAMTGMSKKGIRIYFVGKIKLFNQLQICGKIGCTITDEQRENKCKGNAKIQIVWKI